MSVVIQRRFVLGEIMASEKYAIDLDSLNTNIYKLGSGLVLSEPTVATVSADDRKQVKDVGDSAKKIIGKTTKNTKIVFPVFEGEIINEDVASRMLSNFMDKVSEGSRLFGVTALFSVPCGSDFAMIEKVKRVAKNAGIKKCYFAESPILSALGQRIPLSDSTPFFVIDMAGGTTNIAAVTLDGVIAGLSVNFGANKITTDIIDYVAEKYSMQIGLLTAENLKNEVGSLENDDALSLVVNGRNINTGAPMALSIRGMDILPAVKQYYDKIAEIAISVMSKLPPEVSAEIRHSGIYVSGVASNMYGLERYYDDKFDMQINIAEDGKLSVALGGGVALGDTKLLEKICLNFD